MRKIEPKPSNLKECMTALGDVLTSQERAEVIGMSKKELIQCHHGLGRWIRNNWDLWQGGPLFDHMKSLGFIHPDDMSMAIIKEFWAQANQKPSEINDDIKKYQEYWNKQGQNES